MNVKHEWIINFLLALALAMCLFIFVDITYEDRIWEFGAFTLKIRILSLGITIVTFYLASYLYRQIAHSFIRKSKDEKKVNWKEYALVFLLNFIFINIIHLFITFFINDMGFRWRESLLINVSAAVLLLLYYTVIRNRILFKDLMQQSLQLEKVKVDQLETELKFLKSQYHPHFLFNALNTIYFQVDEDNKEARQSIEQLSDLLRYQLYDIEQEVAMEQEINYLRSYIAFQQLRMTARLTLDMYFDPELKDQKIHPLLFQPLIENAFKYVRGDYRIQLAMKLNQKQIRLEIKNSISPSQNPNSKRGGGIGIENLRRRLDLLYPGKYKLEIKQTESMFVAILAINAD